MEHLNLDGKPTFMGLLLTSFNVGLVILSALTLNKYIQQMTAIVLTLTAIYYVFKIIPLAKSQFIIIKSKLKKNRK